MRYDDAVSVVVGEMLMIALVVVLIAAATAAFPLLLPSDRSVSVNILVMYDDHNVSLYHKGGDWMRTSELVVSAEFPDGSREFWREGDTGFVLEPHAGLELPATAKKQTFDLGDVVKVSLTKKPVKVKLSTADSVVVTAEV